MNSALLDRDTRVVRAPDALASVVNGEVVMMSVAKGEYFSLTGVAVKVWDLLAEPASLQDMSVDIAGQYGIQASECLPDIQAFVADLIAAGLAKVV